jgi:hypothetical protein
MLPLTVPGCLTGVGHKVVRAEAQRLVGAVGVARARRLLSGAEMKQFFRE